VPLAAQYRREAERYRKLAAAETSPPAAQQLLDYAKQYDAWASILEEEEEEGKHPPPPSTAPQPQPMQQQQTKLEPDDKE
jgi:hypothetical protein